MDTDQIEQALEQRAGHHDATFVAEQLPGGGWRAAFKREDEDVVVLSAEATTREEAVQKLYESDELEDLRGG